MNHIAPINVSNNSSFAASVSVTLGMVTRDVIEVNFIGKVEQEVVTAGWVN